MRLRCLCLFECGEGTTGAKGCGEWRLNLPLLDCGASARCVSNEWGRKDFSSSLCGHTLSMVVPFYSNCLGIVPTAVVQRSINLDSIHMCLARCDWCSFLSANAGTRQRFTVSDGARRLQSSNDKRNETRPVETTSLQCEAVWYKYIMHVLGWVKIASHPKMHMLRHFFYFSFCIIRFFDEIILKCLSHCMYPTISVFTNFLQEGKNKTQKDCKREKFTR